MPEQGLTPKSASGSKERREKREKERRKETDAFHGWREEMRSLGVPNIHSPNDGRFIGDRLPPLLPSEHGVTLGVV